MLIAVDQLVDTGKDVDQEETEHFTMDIGDAEAGRELDGLIAEKIMGFVKLSQWTWNPDDGIVWRWRLRSPEEARTLTDGFPEDYIPATEDHVPFNNTFVTVPHYSTDITAAWEVIKRLIDDGIGLPEIIHDGQLWVVSIRDFGKVAVTASAETAPLAICRAALKAIEEAE